MLSDAFRTILEPGFAQTRVLGSRFFASALPARSELEVEQHLVAERRTRHDATHWCFAARLGVGEKTAERASDAGEPRGTAGLPILHEARVRGLTNVLVIVSRYFGGTKLGTGNLARAYADCAGQALDQASVVERLVMGRVRARCPYSLQSTVYRVAQKFDSVVEPLESAGQAEFLIHLRAGATQALCAALTEEGRGRIIATGEDV